MGLDYLDMMIIHSPQPWDKVNQCEDRYVEGNRAAWRALEEAYKEGKLRAIGVSNFQIGDLNSLLEGCTVKPMVNQILLHISNTPLGLVEVGHGVSVAEGMPISVAVRPEKIRISLQRPERARPNVFSGKVVEIAYLGDVNTYIVHTPEGVKIKITDINSMHDSEGEITWDDEVFFWWNPQFAVVLTH